MRLDLLLAREPFPDLFTVTLSDYLRHRCDWRGKMEWHTGLGGGRHALLANAKLNLIFPPSCPTDQLRELAAEYSYHPHPLRRLLQSWYVRYAVTRLWRHPLACAHINIDPWPEIMSDWCILPGNHSIRIIDMRRGLCIVLRKPGFNEKFMRTEIDLRREFPDLPCPRVLDVNVKEGWYTEERIAGLPLNRLANSEDVSHALAAGRKALVSLYQQTAQDVTVDDWLEDRQQRIASAVEGLPQIYNAVVRGRALRLTEMLANVLRQTLQDKMSIKYIPSSVTHGDFQPANILVSLSREYDPLVYLIDWEYSGRRCRWYDALVFELRSRFPAGLAGRITDWVKNDALMAETLAWCGIDAVGQWDAPALIVIFLLDDLLLRIEDTTIPGLKNENRGFLDFLDELDLLRLNHN